LNFVDAVSNLMQGKRMVRPNWVGYYIILLPGQSYIWQVGNTSASIQPNSMEYVASVPDINATDWSVKTT
jgi:hypothetical protein